MCVLRVQKFLTRSLVTLNTSVRRIGWLTNNLSQLRSFTQNGDISIIWDISGWHTTTIIYYHLAQIVTGIGGTLGGVGIGKADRFPVAGFRAFLPGDETKERPLLIDPTREDPNNHFEFFEDGTMRASTDAGLETIELLGLNTREVLVRERQRAYTAGRTILSAFVEEAKRRDSADVDYYRAEVNKIWTGETGYAAFGRRGLKYPLIFKRGRRPRRRLRFGVEVLRIAR